MTRAMILLIGALAVAAHADDAARWQEPFQLQLPEPTRTVTLGRGVDAAAFIEANGLEGANVVPLGRAGTLIEAPMEEAEWQNLAEQVCSTDGVTGCDVNIVWEPPWGPEMISPEGREKLGMD